MTADGNIVLAGWTLGSWANTMVGVTDAAAVKLDANGTELWRWQVKTCLPRPVGTLNSADRTRDFDQGERGCLVFDRATSIVIRPPHIHTIPYVRDINGISFLFVMFLLEGYFRLLFDSAVPTLVRLLPFCATSNDLVRARCA